MKNHINPSLAGKSVVVAIPALFLGSFVLGRAQAATLYATSISGSQIYQVDTSTNTVTNYVTTPTAPDSIIFDSSGRVIYSQLYAGEVDRYDPVGMTTTTLAVGLSTPADMVLEPSGNSMLVSEFTGGKI